MKRLSTSPDSLGAYMSICPNSTDEQSQGNNPMYTREFQTILEGFDEEGCVEESGHVSEKKRRLSVDQVKALEKNFEVENKLEPERKVKLAQELGLQPRQVAIWFQNRRARWKTKQLERDYGILKASYDALKSNFENLQSDNETLLKEIEELKSKVNEDGTSDEIQVSVKEEPMAMSDNEEKTNLETPFSSDETGVGLNFETFIVKNDENVTLFGDLKDGSSDDSDSSAILNEENNTSSSPIAANSSNGILHFSPPHQFQKGSCSSMNISFQFSDTKDQHQHHNHQTQFVKIEEHNFIGEDSCSTFFSEEQAPTLHWYDWN